MPSVDVVHVNPGMFAFTYLLGLPVIANLGLLALPFGDGMNAPPSNEDIGAVAAGVLADPAPYIGRCLRPMGPRLLSPQDVARILSNVLERKIKYRAVSTKMFIKAARAQGFPRFEIAQVRHYAAEMRAGAYAQEPNDHVEEVCGRKPEDFETTARRYIDDPDHIVRGLKKGGLAGSLALVLRMLLMPALDLDRWEAERDYPLISNGELAHDNPDWVQAALSQRLLLQPYPKRLSAGGTAG